MLLVDDHAMVRESIARMLTEQTGFDVMHCGGVDEALRLLQSNPIDLLLLDYDLGQERATDLLLRLDEASFDGPTAILTAHVSSLVARRLIQMGVSGILLKSQSMSMLGTRLRDISAGAKWLDEGVETGYSQLEESATPSHPEFTLREGETLRDLLGGLSSKEIAIKHDISESAVKATIQRLFRKTGTRTRSQLVRVILEQGLVSAPLEPDS
ncbi:MAG TPA: response regulator transcription factor [Terracidiphilus sp.]|nr:response regulator transcription factor [Terracidiphilus sp.]